MDKMHRPDTETRGATCKFCGRATRTGPFTDRAQPVCRHERDEECKALFLERAQRPFKKARLGDSNLW